MPTSPSNSIDHQPLAPAERHTPQQEGTNPGQPRLSSRQILALPILAVAPNRRQAALEAGVSEATLYRWLRNAQFRAELDRLTAQAADFTRSEIENLARQSFIVLTDLMGDPDPAVRLRASRTVAAMGIQICEADALRRDNHDLEETKPARASGHLGRQGCSRATERVMNQAASARES